MTSRREPVDLDTLEIGRRYRVDRKNEELRRSFRFTGTLLAIEDAGTGEAGELARVLVFEVKPRFGRPTRQAVHAETLLAVDPI